MAVKLDLVIAVQEYYQRIRSEGDSKMTSRILKKLKQGTQWDKINKSWRTSRKIQEIGQLLHQRGYVIPKHVRRESNEAADYLAN